MKKLGLVPIVLAVATTIILLTGVVLNVFIGTQITMKTYAKEAEIVKASNLVQSIKKGLPYALYYSYLEALRRNGYETYLDVVSRDKFRRDVSLVFSEYVKEIEGKSGVVVPNGQVELSSSRKEVVITFSSSGFLEHSYDSEEFSFRILENPNTTVKVPLPECTKNRHCCFLYPESYVVCRDQKCELCDPLSQECYNCKGTCPYICTAVSECRLYGGHCDPKYSCVNLPCCCLI